MIDNFRVNNKTNCLKHWSTSHNSLILSVSSLTRSHHHLPSFVPPGHHLHPGSDQQEVIEYSHQSSLPSSSTDFHLLLLLQSEDMWRQKNCILSQAEYRQHASQCSGFAWNRHYHHYLIRKNPLEPSKSKDLRNPLESPGFYFLLTVIHPLVPVPWENLLLLLLWVGWETCEGVWPWASREEPRPKGRESGGGDRSWCGAGGTWKLRRRRRRRSRRRAPYDFWLFLGNRVG